MLLLTGCTVKSEITVNYDGSVNENVYILNSNNVFGDDEEKIKSIVDNKITNYKSILNFKNYSYTYEKGEELSGAKVYKDYDDICSFFGNSAFNQYVYKYMDCIENQYYFEIKNATEYIPYCSECGEWPALDDVIFSINLPVSAEEQNADEIDGNTYIWKYNKDTDENKSFYLKVSKTLLEDYKEKYEENLQKKEKIKKYITFGFILLLIVLIVIISINLYKKYKKNKLDY